MEQEESTCKPRCISAGMNLMREEWAHKPEASSPVVFAENVAGLVSIDGMKVPHSELAIHTRAAGKKVLAYVLGRNSVYVAYEDDECCGFTFGLPNELLSNELIETTRDLFGPKR